MTFETLSEYFVSRSEIWLRQKKLGATSSRLSLIDILAALFGHSSKEEIDKIIYLTQGRIAPFFEPLEMGMAEKNVAKLVAINFDFI